MECKHKLVTLCWSPEGCGCCGDLSALCTICQEVIYGYFNYHEIERLNLDEDEDE